jgi:hypothetical protein
MFSVVKKRGCAIVGADSVAAKSPLRGQVRDWRGALPGSLREYSAERRQAVPGEIPFCQGNQQFAVDG